MASSPKTATNRYSRILEEIFFGGYRKGKTRVPFHRDELGTVANRLGISIPKNLGDVIYSVRFRVDLPQSILDTQPAGLVWRIKLAGRAQYEFVLGRDSRILPNAKLKPVSVPDATPSIISLVALDDEQALLAVVRYNRLVDTFLGVTSYSLQNHLRTTVAGIGQVEVDELYVAIDGEGRRFVIPIQAKGGKDQISVVQTEQDLALCAEKFPDHTCMAVSVQFMEGGVIAMFHLTVDDEELKLIRERHYRLIGLDEMKRLELADHRTGRT